MKSFTKPEPPADWPVQVVAKGTAWLAQGANASAERPRDYWTGKNKRFVRQLAKGFGWLCGYTVMWSPSGTVDHYRPWSELRGTPDALLAYDWSNLRYSCEWFNRDRKNIPVPDPFVVEDDWFELLLPSCELVATSKVPPDEAPRVANALRWLGIHPSVVEARQGYLEAYTSGDLSLTGLRKWAPLVATALERSPNLLRPADRRRLQRAAHAGATP